MMAVANVVITVELSRIAAQYSYITAELASAPSVSNAVSDKVN